MQTAAVVLIPILVACALNLDLRNSLNMGVMLFGKRASAAQIGIIYSSSKFYSLANKLSPSRAGMNVAPLPGDALAVLGLGVERVRALDAIQKQQAVKVVQLVLKDARDEPG